VQPGRRGSEFPYGRVQAGKTGGAVRSRCWQRSPGVWITEERFGQCWGGIGGVRAGRSVQSPSRGGGREASGDLGGRYRRWVG